MACHASPFDGNPRLTASRNRPAPIFRLAIHLLVLFAATLVALPLRADVAKSADLLRTGEYEAALKLADKAIDENQYSELWRHHQIRALLALGDYPRAKAALETALTKYHTSIRLRVLGHKVFQSVGDAEQAKLMLEQINQLVSARPWWYSEGLDLVAQGRAALLMGADPRQVLQIIYDKAKKEYPNLVDVHIAGGELALGKDDYTEAARWFSEAAKKFPDDPEVWFGFARAFVPSDGEKTAAAVEKALELNPRHVGALLMLLDHQIDSEQSDAAEETLAKVLAVNPAHPQAWALAAALAHLENDAAQEAQCRARALRYWKANPAVDHLIGRKLSQKYRFAEGAAYQRKSLAADKEYLPAKMQLASDLLRLGEVAEGWKLAREVLDKDAYNVAAYNLVTLQDNIAKFTTLENEHFIIRMESREAAIYGDRVLDLLERARKTLGEKYGLESKDRTTVEIFPDQKDFAVRTFGLPGGQGFLGVCFGKVITANSPAAMARATGSATGRANIEAVLWHEYCHVVTLGATRNRMPRWLSEGISVYEEKQANAAWGQAMDPTFRRMILHGELTPVGKLSAAFLRAKSPLHLQFAYFESSLVVEFVIRKAGIDALRKVLRDLHEGVYINDAISRHVGPIKDIEAEFETWAREQAKLLAPKADWTPLPEEAAGGGEALDAFLKDHPDSHAALAARAQQLLAAKEYEEAKHVLRRMIELYPNDANDDSAYVALAYIHRQLKETNEERGILEKFAALSSDHLPTFQRVMELAAERKDWPTVSATGQRALAVNPLSPQPWRLLAQAALAAKDHALGARANRVLLQMDPPDPAQVHFELATHLHALNDASAKRHALMALEEAPRFRAAQELLLKLSEANEKGNSSVP